MHKYTLPTFALMALSFVSGTVLRAQEKLRKEVLSVIETINGEAGVSIKHFKTGDTLSVNGHDRFPMQSVFKFHLGLAVLSEVDRGKLTIDQKVFIDKKDLQQNTWSPIAKTYPDGNVELTIKQLLEFTVAQSDNNGCDILMQLIGGPAKVNEYIHRLGIKDVNIVYNEEEMARAWDLQFDNWTTPMAMNQLLEVFYQQRILSPSSQKVLIQILEETTTGPKRIKGLLPAGTPVAHKTGTGGLSENNILGAMNDVGIITLPNGDHIAISVFIARAKDDPAKLELAIAKMSKLIYDYYK